MVGRESLEKLWKAGLWYFFIFMDVPGLFLDFHLLFRPPRLFFIRERAVGVVLGKPSRYNDNDEHPHQTQAIEAS